MAMISCSRHGFTGAASVTPAVSDAFDSAGATADVELVELVWDEIPFYLYALRSELPLPGTERDGSTYQVREEEALNSILDLLVPKCGKCMVERFSL